MNYRDAIIPLAKAKEKTGPMQEFKSETIKLPEPQYDSDVSIEKALLKRRSVRSFKDSPLTLTEVSQLLWAAQGITSSRGLTHLKDRCQAKKHPYT